MKRSVIIMLSGILFFFDLKAQSQKITASQAIEMSIANSGTLKLADVRLAQAEADLREAKDRQLPDVSVSGSYLRLGGADVDLKNKNPNSGSGNSPSVNQAFYGIANLSYPVYAGGRIKYGIESAKYLVEAARLNGSQDKDAIIFNTLQAYTNLYKASRAVSVFAENLRAAVQRDSSFSRLEQNGLLARNDLLKSQLQSSNIELSLLEAQSNLTVANVNMALILGLPENSLIETDSSFINISPLPETYPALEAMALQNRKDVQALTFQEKAAALGIKSARAEIYPSVAITGGYVAADIPKLITVTNAVNIGIGVQYKLSSLWKTNTKLLQAREQETAVKVQEGLLRDNIRSLVNVDYQSYLLSQKKIDVFEKAIVQAQENYRITKNKYDNSLITITELLEADVALLQTRLNVTNAKADAALAYNKLLATTGTIQKN